MIRIVVMSAALLAAAVPSYADWDMRPENLSPKEQAMQKPCTDQAKALSDAWQASVAAGTPLDHEARHALLKQLGATCEQWNDYVGKKHKATQ